MRAKSCHRPWELYLICPIDNLQHEGNCRVAKGLKQASERMQTPRVAENNARRL
ncbi:hypothetical protein [Aeoliella sp. SH292]|uniref:hypothetical protein n=1 Tax=Aeoliella sp. SH292 TaxID=3454464 RepID=UPI003F9E6614